MSWANFVVPGTFAAVAVTFTRFPAFAWLIAAGLALPRSRVATRVDWAGTAPAAGQPYGDGRLGESEGVDG